MDKTGEVKADHEDDDVDVVVGEIADVFGVCGSGATNEDGVNASTIIMNVRSNKRRKRKRLCIILSSGTNRGKTTIFVVMFICLFVLSMTNPPKKPHTQTHNSCLVCSCL
jgi:hypothetical protein